MKHTDTIAFVESQELEFPEFQMDIVESTATRSVPLEVSEELVVEQFSEANYVNNHSLVSFAANVSPAHRQDILNATLFAQLVANKMVKSEENVMDWYTVYSDVLQNIGWNIERKEINQTYEGHSVFEMENAIFDVFGQLIVTLGGNYLSYLPILKKIINILKNLNADDQRFLLFEKNSHDTNQGKFQIALANETDQVVSILISGFRMTTNKTIQKILFFKSDTNEVQLDYSVMLCTLNTAIYGTVREQILKKLGNTASRFIAKLPDLDETFTTDSSM